MKAVFWLVFFVVLFLAGVRYIERRSIYFPMRQMGITPQDAGSAYEDIYFETSDRKKLNGWFVPVDNAKFAFLFAHGNAGNISHRIEKISILRDLGVNIFVFDYRGYGKSSGTPSERGFYEDAEAAYDYLVKERKIPEDNIIFYGESIGGAVVINLAQKKKAGALITEGTFTSISDMAKMAYPFVPSFIFSSRFNSVAKIGNIACPKLIIHSIDDEIVPFHLGRKLFNAAKEPKEFLEIRGSHNTAFLDSEEKFRKGIKSFLERLAQLRP